MMSIGTSEILVVLVIGLIVLGPERLPKVAKSVARMYRELRKYAEDVRRDLSKEMTLDDTPSTPYKRNSSSEAPDEADSTYDYGYSEDDGEEEADQDAGGGEDTGSEPSDSSTGDDEMPDDEQVGDEDDDEPARSVKADEETTDEESVS